MHVRETTVADTRSPSRLVCSSSSRSLIQGHMCRYNMHGARARAHTRKTNAPRTYHWAHTKESKTYHGTYVVESSTSARCSLREQTLKKFNRALTRPHHYSVFAASKHTYTVCVYMIVSCSTTLSHFLH